MRDLILLDIPLGKIHLSWWIMHEESNGDFRLRLCVSGRRRILDPVRIFVHDNKKGPHEFLIKRRTQKDAATCVVRKPRSTDGGHAENIIEPKSNACESWSLILELRNKWRICSTWATVKIEPSHKIYGNVYTNKGVLDTADGKARHIVSSPEALGRPQP